MKTSSQLEASNGKRELLKTAVPLINLTNILQAAILIIFFQQKKDRHWTGFMTAVANFKLFYVGVCMQCSKYKKLWLTLPLSKILTQPVSSEKLRITLVFNEETARKILVKLLP